MTEYHMHIHGENDTIVLTQDDVNLLIDAYLARRGPTTPADSENSDTAPDEARSVEWATLSTVPEGVPFTYWERELDDDEAARLIGGAIVSAVRDAAEHHASQAQDTRAEAGEQ